MKDPLKIFSSGQLKNQEEGRSFLDKFLSDPLEISRYSKLEFITNISFCLDQVVVPRSSTSFGLNWSSKTCKIKNFKKSLYYKENQLAIRTLYDSGRLHNIIIDGPHDFINYDNLEDLKFYWTD